MWYKLKRIMMRPNGVEKQVRPSGWQPWANTVAYRPLNNVSWLNDLSGNQNHLIAYWGDGTFTNNSWSNNSTHYLKTTSSIWFASWQSFFFSIFFKITGTDTSGGTYSNPRLFAPPTRWYYIVTLWRPWNPTWLDFNESNYWHEWTTPITYSIPRNAWNFAYYTWTVWQSNWIWGLITPDWVNHNSATITPLVIQSWIITIWRNWDSGFNDAYFYWELSNAMIEDKLRTVQEVQDYYNLTKSNYWL